MEFDTDGTHVVRFTTAVRSATRLPDLLALALVPAVLWGVYRLPESVRRGLVFDYTDPSLATAFTSAFVHIGPGHLLVNLAGYVLVVPTAYLLSALSGRRRRFFVSFCTFLLAFPVILSYLNWAVLRPATSLGFSGVLLAFVGYLPIAIGDYFEEHFDVGPTTSLAPVLFFLTFSLISLLSIRSVVAYRTRVVVGTSGLAFAAILMAVLYLLSVVEGDDRLWANLRAASTRGGYFELSVVALFVFVSVPVAAFPADPTESGQVMNFYAHLLGFALGFTVTYATICVGDRLPGVESSL